MGELSMENVCVHGSMHAWSDGNERMGGAWDG